jgi:gliding motility-associated-like protein
LPSNQNARVNIFDRYGKLLVEFQAQNHPGWNGTYNGKLMANNDYWYLIQLDDGRVLRGNLTLKR